MSVLSWLIINFVYQIHIILLSSCMENNHIAASLCCPQFPIFAETKFLLVCLQLVREK